MGILFSFQYRQDAHLVLPQVTAAAQCPVFYEPHACVASSMFAFGSVILDPEHVLIALLALRRLPRLEIRKCKSSCSWNAVGSLSTLYEFVPSYKDFLWLCSN